MIGAEERTVKPTLSDACHSLLGVVDNRHSVLYVGYGSCDHPVCVTHVVLANASNAFHVAAQRNTWHKKMATPHARRMLRSP